MIEGNGVEEAYRRGWCDSIPGDPEADRLVLNPFDGDSEPLLFDAYERGRDDRLDQFGTAVTISAVVGPAKS
jgi:hypothetical protein